MQLELPWQREDALREELERKTGLSLELVITDNRSSVLALRRGANGHYRLRLHRMFLQAGPDVVKQLAAWLAGKPSRKAAGQALDRFIECHRHLLREAPPRQVREHTRGACFDLRQIFDELNTRWFGGELKTRITWGRAPSRGRRKSIHFGTYSQESDLIRIHRHLDQPSVPAFFVRSVVYHEMLHAALGFRRSRGGRRMAHTAEFRRAEQAFPEYEKARQWQEDPANLRRLLAPSAPPGRTAR